MSSKDVLAPALRGVETTEVAGIVAGAVAGAVVGAVVDRLGLGAVVGAGASPVVLGAGVRPAPAPVPGDGPVARGLPIVSPSRRAPTGAAGPGVTTITVLAGAPAGEPDSSASGAPESTVSVPWPAGDAVDAAVVSTDNGTACRLAALSVSVGAVAVRPPLDEHPALSATRTASI